MTAPSTDEALEVYLQYPMDDGEAVLLLPDDGICLELGPLPGQDRLPDHAAALARALTGSRALLAVARRGRRPRPADLLLWTELCAALSGTGTALLPLELLPAA